MGWLHYDYTISPSNPSAVVQATTITPQKITLSVTSMDTLTVTLSVPSNSGFLQKLIDTIAIPVALIVGRILQNKINDMVTGQSFDQNFNPPIGYTLTVEGVQITVQAATLSAAGYQGFIAFTGTVTVG